MVEITRLESADALEDRTILECIQSLAAEEQRVRRAAEVGVADQRLTEIQANLDELWGLLRSRRAQREAGSVPDSLVGT